MKNRLKRLSFSMLLIIFAFNTIKAQTPPIAGNWESISTFTDEFNGGSLNTSKWVDHDPAWVGRHPSFFEPSNVSVNGGLLKLRCRNFILSQDNVPTDQSGYTHATAAIKSKTKVLYGYFETRAKASDSRYFNSFWLYDDNGYAWTEIDIFEIVAEKDYLVRTSHLFYNNTYQGTVGDHIKSQQENGPWWNGNAGYADWGHSAGYYADYHTYGLDWNVNTLTWYVDGVEVFSTPNLYWHHYLYVIFDAEVMTWPEDLPSKDITFDIDYVRTWKNNEIKTVNAPTSVSRGQTVTFSVDYEAASSKTISCTFQQSVSPWDSYVSTSKTVGAGVGTVNFTMTIPSYVPLGSNYQFQTFIGDGTWGGLDHNLPKKPITVSSAKSAQSTLDVSKTESSKNDISIYPNPGIGRFNLHFASAFIGDISIQLLSFDGRVIETQILQKQEVEFSHEFNIENQIPGAYIIKVIANDFQSQQILIKK